MKNATFNQELDPSDPLESNNTETILDSFRYFKGRRYHNLADVTYYLPNDDKEAERENLQHNLFKFIWKNNFSSPVHELLKSGKAKVLDIGCGTGLWLLDMAKDYPQATFVGIDMSPIFPNVKSIPSNVVFLQHNLNDGIPFPDETFDFVFQRFLCNCVLFEKWKFYVKEMIRITKPGGWLEFFEYDQSQHEEDTNSFHQQVLESVTSGFKAKGINSRPQFCVPTHLEECQGLSKVHCKEKHTPAGDRAEQLGVMMKTYSEMNAEAIKLLLTSAWGIDYETFDSIIARTTLEFDRYGIHIKSFRWFSKKI